MGQSEHSSLAAAVDAALNDMPDSMVIKSFLVKNKAEVTRMCITEYDEERTLAELREEYREEYLEEGGDKTLHQLSLLKQALKDAGRYDELSDAIDDKGTFKRLLTEFGIE